MSFVQLAVLATVLGTVLSHVVLWYFLSDLPLRLSEALTPLLRVNCSCPTHEQSSSDDPWPGGSFSDLPQRRALEHRFWDAPSLTDWRRPPLGSGWSSGHVGDDSEFAWRGSRSAGAIVSRHPSSRKTWPPPASWSAGGLPLAEWTSAEESLNSSLPDLLLQKFQAALGKGSSCGSGRAIPKIIHVTWKEWAVPLKYSKMVANCVNLHSDWDFMFWSDVQNERLVGSGFDFSSTSKSGSTPLSGVSQGLLWLFWDQESRCCSAGHAVRPWRHLHGHGCRVSIPS
mmetsp:Transcript_126750/g.289937  ORF Transcript_126750/g.289937 Transcript_126750/m.289937 type:complete len:284 (-) Transcript_126750:673-1524(-)